MNGKRIGEFLKEQRIKNNLTQDELASKLYVSRYVISKWERGIRIPSTDYLTKLSTILNINVTDILNGGIVNKENLNKVTIDIIKYQDKKIKHLMYQDKSLHCPFCLPADTYHKTYRQHHPNH